MQNINNYTCRYAIDDELSMPYSIEFETTDYDFYLYMRNMICREIDKLEREAKEKNE